MYNHNNLLPLKVTSKNGVSPVVKSIAFYGNRTIATDTFRLLEVSATGAAHDAKTLPASEIKATTIPKKQLEFTLDEIETAVGIIPNPNPNYPDVDKIMSEDDTIEYATIKINGELLGGLLEAMSKISKFGVVEMRVPINTPYKAIHCYARTEDGQWQEDAEGVRNWVPKQTAHGLMMPLTRQ